MTQPPPPSPEKPTADAPDERSIQEQLDELLVAIEKQEPGTLEPDALPEAYRQELEAQAEPAPEPEPEPKTAGQEPAEPTPQAEAEAASAATDDEIAEAVAQFEGAIGDNEQAAEQPAEQAAPGTDTEPAPEAAAAEAAQADEPPAQASEQDMLAALNEALKDLQPDDTASFGPPKKHTETAPSPAPEPEPEPAPEPAAEAKPADQAPARKSDEDLQAEINALLSAPPTAPAAEQDDEQEQIAEQVEGLLNAEAGDDAADASASIDDLDQALAEEIDLDDELDDDLLGDFQSVQDVTAGIQTNEPADADDAHAATARDVAAELDSQPEATPPAEAAPAEDPLEALSHTAGAAEDTQAEHAAPGRWTITLPAWFGKLRLAANRLLRACFILNWPARRFLTPEWRANLGYLALIHLFIGVAMWLYLLVR